LAAYSTKKFGGLLASGLVVGLVITAVVGWSIQSLFSANRFRAYYQLVSASQPSDMPSEKPTAHHWASISHTLVVLDARNVVSMLTITAKEAPYIQNNTIKIDFDDPHTYASDDPAPRVLEGNLSWSGIFNKDLHLNETITIWTRLEFDLDATYFVGSWVLSYSSEVIAEGYGTVFYVTVEQGKIAKVTDELGHIPSSTELDAVEFQP